MSILETKCPNNCGSLDEKLADYVFFPLSQILRRKQKYTDQLSELIIKCVKILLQYGWRRSLSLDLAKQLLMLLSFVAGGKPTKDDILIPEELLYEAYSALVALFSALHHNSQILISDKNSDMIHVIGYSVTVIIDGIVNGPTISVQLESLEALAGAWSCVKDREALSKFLPGTVSALTKCLVPTTSARRSQKVLVRGLEVLCHTLTLILSDIVTRNINSSSRKREETSACDSSDEKALTPTWLKTTTGQIKLALSNIIKLRSHQAVEVRKALNKFCITILDECHDTLYESSNILTETCMILHGVDCENNFYKRRTNLKDLALIHKDINDLIKCNTQSWLMTLPKVMAVHDDTAKLSAVTNLSNAQALLVDLNIKSSMLEQLLFRSLRESIIAILDPSMPSEVLKEVLFDSNNHVISNSIMQLSSSTIFHPIIMCRENEKEIRGSFMNLLANLRMSGSQIRLASEMLEYARHSSGPCLIPSYWLSFQIFKQISSRSKEIEELIDSELFLSNDQVLYEQELFSYSVSLLRKNSDEIDDWRLQAIALEVVAETAQRMKYDFRSELIDLLYPIVQLLGSPSQQLREHTITCLNIFTSSCGYENTSALIVNNADYLMNDISLRLNTFSIVPQGLQVLIMMIHLAGPNLLPYLDDVVDSIFAALANYHGYEQLVRILFSVLQEIVSVGSNPDYLKLTNSKTSVSHRKKSIPPITIESIVTAYLPQRVNSEMKILSHETFPEESWNTAQVPADKVYSDMQSNHDYAGSTEVQKSAPTKVYKMLQSIARLSQHYLTSSSPVLRLRLLELIRKSSLALSMDEDSYLPLINEIWPVVIKRIYDNESFVCVATCDTIAELCTHAGDFLSTRISVEWPALLKLARISKINLIQEKKKVGARGTYTLASQVWEAILRLMTAILTYVRLEDEIFDNLLDLLGSLAWEKDEIKNAMKAVNPDALWLVKYMSGGIELQATPILDDHKFVQYNNNQTFP